MGFGFEIPQELRSSLPSNIFQKGKDSHRSSCPNADWVVAPPPSDRVTVLYWAKHVEKRKLRQPCKFITRSSYWMTSHHDEWSHYVKNACQSNPKNGSNVLMSRLSCAYPGFLRYNASCIVCIAPPRSGFHMTSLMVQVFT